MAPLEKEASHREKILTDASVRLALIKRRLEPARSQLAALTARRDGVLDEMAGLVSQKKRLREFFLLHQLTRQS